MSVLHVPARMEPPALTMLVIIPVNAWLHLKVMTTEREEKANIINFKEHLCLLSDLISVSQQHYGAFISFKSASKVTNQLSLRQK